MQTASSSSYGGRSASLARRRALSAGKTALPPATERVRNGDRSAALPASVPGQSSAVAQSNAAAQSSGAFSNSSPGNSFPPSAPTPLPLAHATNGVSSPSTGANGRRKGHSGSGEHASIGVITDGRRVAIRGADHVRLGCGAVLSGCRIGCLHGPRAGTATPRYFESAWPGHTARCATDPAPAPGEARLRAESDGIDDAWRPDRYRQSHWTGHASDRR